MLCLLRARGASNHEYSIFEIVARLEGLTWPTLHMCLFNVDSPGLAFASSWTVI